jgi:hypothetical protein
MLDMFRDNLRVHKVLHLGVQSFEYDSKKFSKNWCKVLNYKAQF